jgi:hypothetical protein
VSLGAAREARITGHTYPEQAMPSLTACLSLAGALGATAGCAFDRRWLFAAAWACHVAYTLFDKFYTGVLPQPLVDGFAALMLVLVLVGLGKMLAAGHNARAAR